MPGKQDRRLTPLGELLEHARQKILHISAREAARRSGLSEGWWRQVVTGVHRTARGELPVRPTPQSVVAMALGVGVDPGKALRAADISVTPEALATLVAEARRPQHPTMEAVTTDEITAEIRRINGLDLDPTTKWRLIQQLIELLQQITSDQQRAAN